jgi:outer membrane receptor protein involved in Fe transport
MLKTGSLYRDAEGYNVSGGRSRHRGLELNTTWQIVDSLWLTASASYARHTYEFDVTAERGETFVSGNDIDTAPRWFGNAELNFAPLPRATFSLQWVAVGDYFLDAENRFSYPGHELLNFRAMVELTAQFTITARLYNILDTDYADRADYAFGEYRYFPGRGRELFVELQYLRD